MAADDKALGTEINMIIRIAIADNNEEYLERLLSVLEEYDEVNLSVYTDRHSLELALSSRQFDVLLFNPEVYDGQITLKKSTLPVLLLDEEQGVPESCREFTKVNKYQRISGIYKKVLELYAQISGDIGGVLGGDTVRMVAFYSPIGGAGKTTLALATATKLALMGYRTFYLNFEDIASEDCYLPQNAEKGISEIVASLGSDINFSMKIQSFLQTKMENLYYMNHFDSPNDVYEIKEEEIEELLEHISKTGLFDFIVIDMGTSISSKARRIFEIVQKIILVERSDAISARKMQCFLNQAHIINAYGGKMLRVLNFGSGSGKMLDSEVKIGGRIGALHNPDAEQLITMFATSTDFAFMDALVN